MRVCATRCPCRRWRWSWRCSALRLLLLLCLHLLFSLDGALEAAAVAVAASGGRERGGYDEAGQSRLRWEMPRAVVTDTLSLDPKASFVPLCPLLDGSWRAWLLRQYADGRGEAASVRVAMQADHCTAHYEEHKHKTKTFSGNGKRAVRAFLVHVETKVISCDGRSIQETRCIALELQ